MVDFTSLRATAARLISENGRDIILVRKDRVNLADPTKPWRGTTGASEIQVTAKAVIGRFEAEDFSGTLIRRGEKQALVAASAAEIAANDASVELETFAHVLDGLTRWDIDGGEVIEPGPVRVLYILNLRQ